MYCRMCVDERMQCKTNTLILKPGVTSNTGWGREASYTTDNSILDRFLGNT